MLQGADGNSPWIYFTKYRLNDFQVAWHILGTKRLIPNSPFELIVEFYM